MAYGKIYEGDRPETQVNNTVGTAAWANELQDQLAVILGPKWMSVPFTGGNAYDASGAFAYDAGINDGGTILRPCWKWTTGSGAGLLRIPIPWAREGMRITESKFVVDGTVAAPNDGGISIAQQMFALSGGKPSAVMTTYLVHTDPWNHAGAYTEVAVAGLAIDIVSNGDWFVVVVGPTGAGDDAKIFDIEFLVQLDS